MTRSIFSTGYSLFRSLLTQARCDAGLTQADLARRLDRPQSYVSKYERGERRLDLIEFLDAAAAIGIDPCDFIKKLEEALERQGATESE